MPVNKGQSKAASAAKQSMTNADDTDRPSGRDSPTTPQQENRTPYSSGVHPMTSRTAYKQMATVDNMHPIIPAHKSPQAAGRSTHDNAEPAPQSKQPLQMFGSHRSGYQDKLDPSGSAMFSGAYSSAESSYGFGALGQRPDHALNIENHQAQNFQNYQAQSFPNHQAQNVQNPQAHIQNYYQAQNMHNYHPAGGKSEQYYQLALLNPNSQQYGISLKHNDTADDTESLYVHYLDNGVYAGPKVLPGGATPSSHPSSSPAKLSHVGVGQHEALGPATRANGEPEPAEAATPSQLSQASEDQAFQDQVDILVKHAGDTQYRGIIRDAYDAAKYGHAVWKAKTRGRKGYDQKCPDYLLDHSGQMKARQRLFEAIVNLGGKQDTVSDNGEFWTSLAVRTVRSISALEVELVADRLMEAMRKVQSGIPVAPPDVKIVQEDTFSDKLNAVVEVLSVNKGLCRGVINHIEDVAKVAADPAGELNKKRRNHNNNKTKSLVLSAANQKKGTSRKFKGKGKGKGQGKRPADAEAEAEAEAEVEAEAEPASSAEAVDQEGRPSKRRRTDDHSMTASSNDEAFT